MDFLELAHNRYSCRKLGGHVERALVDKIIEAGLAAPTAVNKQPFRIFYVESKDGAEKISKVTSCTFGAESFLVIGSKAEDAWTRQFDGKNFADVDAAIVATHMMLEIEDLGLATTWVGWFDAPELKKLFPEMEGYELIAMFPLGYAAEDAEVSPKHYARKSAEDLVTVL